MFIGAKRREQKHEPSPYVSINKRGEIVLNWAAVKLLLAW
jgi:hypothetical protein